MSSGMNLELTDKIALVTGAATAQELAKEGADVIVAYGKDRNGAETKPLVGRLATSEESARCIIFVANPIAEFMTGATIDVDGGRDLR
jgi:NAD(P)-dependent dehydrogenase (short-subunit alcohol dehydrogenase family)